MGLEEDFIVVGSAIEDIKRGSTLSLSPSTGKIRVALAPDLLQKKKEDANVVECQQCKGTGIIAEIQTKLMLED